MPTCRPDLNRDSAEIFLADGSDQDAEQLAAALALAGVRAIHCADGGIHVLHLQGKPNLDAVQAQIEAWVGADLPIIRCPPVGSPGSSCTRTVSIGKRAVERRWVLV